MAVEVLKVTDPEKKVTDPVLLELLAKQGIDKDYVKFYQDYAPRFLNGERVEGKSPYAKFYRDLKSAKRFMVVSELPMVKPTGEKIQAGWILSSGKYHAKPNLFDCIVDGTSVTLTCLSDQPDGRKAGSTVSWSPQLFVDEIEQLSSTSRLIDDPTNLNYQQNVLEWDYGICKRRIRMIEGGILGAWVFNNRPSGLVRIKYNQHGDFRLRLGQFKSGDDEETISQKDFDSLTAIDNYPVIISDSMTFYPDASPETSSVDGRARHRYSLGSGVTWATLITAAGNEASDSGVAENFVAIGSDNVSNKWSYIHRIVLLFDTSGLPDSADISAAVCSIRGKTGKQDPLLITPNINIYSSAPDTNTAVIAADYATLGSTAFSTAIAYASWIEDNYNNFSLNASGIAAISKTGITKLGTRNANYDAAGVAPTWVSSNLSRLNGYFSEQGAGYKPKLVVEYTIGPGAPTVTAQPASNIQPTSARLNGKIVDDGGETCEARFRWRKIGAPTWNTTSWQNSLVTDGTFFYDLSGLAPDTEYEFQAQARNSVGESDWSTSETFQTPFPTPYPGLRIAKGGLIAELCLVAAGEGVPDMGGIPKIRKGASTYDIYLVEVDDPDASPVMIQTATGIKAVRRLEVIPSGIIVMWHGTIASIPSGWIICDGNNGTPNLLAKFVEGVATAATNPGTTGGALSKSHSVGTVGGAAGANIYPIHTISDHADIRPPYYDIAFIMKT